MRIDAIKSLYLCLFVKIFDTLLMKAGV